MPWWRWATRPRWRGIAAALGGDAGTAERALADAQRTNRSRARLYDADWARAQAWTLAAAGLHTAALRAVDDAAEVAVRAERWAYEVLALHDRARLGGPAGAAPAVRRLGELARVGDGQLAAACAAPAPARGGWGGGARPPARAPRSRGPPGPRGGPPGTGTPPASPPEPHPPETSLM